LVSNDKVNFLFFGSVRTSKGIRELLEVVKCLNKDNKSTDKLNIIIAGADIFNIMKNNLFINCSFTKILLKQFNDSEMKFLFAKSDIILLPYTKVTQSGVLEMAMHFEKPILTSNLPYFKNILSNCPSFGLSIDTSNINEFSNTIINLSNDNYLHVLTKDLDTYYSQNEYDLFMSNFNSLLSY
jgi:glycosyltransferase involved in cell wall biosynthesis